MNIHRHKNISTFMSVDEVKHYVPDRMHNPGRQRSRNTFVIMSEASVIILLILREVHVNLGEQKLPSNVLHDITHVFKVGLLWEQTSVSIN